MYNTRNDLSHNSAKIDYEAMLITARTALHMKIDSIQDYLNKMQNMLLNEAIKKTDCSIYLNANRVKTLSDTLAVIAETYHTLRECKDRENVTLCNLPKIYRSAIRQLIRIDGYWLKKGGKRGQSFQNYICIVNPTKEDIKNENDYNIFYLFDSWQDVDSFMVSKDRNDNEFVITKIREY